MTRARAKEGTSELSLQSDVGVEVGKGEALQMTQCRGDQPVARGPHVAQEGCE